MMSMMLMLMAFDRKRRPSLSEPAHGQVVVSSLIVADLYYRASYHLCHSWRRYFEKQKQEWQWTGAKGKLDVEKM